ncbi:MAG: molybdate ABC transporter substrate-binding protein [Coriobacteriia bacterium]|nr:molybdate ABC transporter substrate-binding protein [Coriobacteriia bacterium]
MKLKKFLASIIVMTIFAALLGCGAPAQTEDPAPKAPELSSQEAAPEKAESAENDTKEKVSLFLYSGAGLKKAMDDSIAEFEKANPHVSIEANYAGSGKLLGQLQATKTGDLFIVGAKLDFDKAQKEELVSDPFALFNHTPSIVVQQGNPKGIKSLEDLAKEGVTVVLADPDSASIGATSQKIFEKNNLMNINDNVVAQVGTVNEIVASIQAGNADAGIATADSVSSAEGVETILIPKENNINQVITGGVVTFSENPDVAKAFLEFLDDKQGEDIWANYGFIPAE